MFLGNFAISMMENMPCRIPDFLSCVYCMILYDIVCIVASHPAISFAQKQIQFSRLANYAFLFKAGDLQCKLAAAAADDDDDDDDDWSPEHLT